MAAEKQHRPCEALSPPRSASITACMPESPGFETIEAFLNIDTDLDSYYRALKAFAEIWNDKEHHNPQYRSLLKAVSKSLIEGEWNHFKGPGTEAILSKALRLASTLESQCADLSPVATELMNVQMFKAKCCAVRDLCTAIMEKCTKLRESREENLLETSSDSIKATLEDWHKTCTKHANLHNEANDNFVRKYLHSSNQQGELKIIPNANERGDENKEGGTNQRGQLCANIDKGNTQAEAALEANADQRDNDAADDEGGANQRGQLCANIDKGSASDALNVVSHSLSLYGCLVAVTSSLDRLNHPTSKTFDDMSLSLRMLLQHCFDTDAADFVRQYQHKRLIWETTVPQKLREELCWKAYECARNCCVKLLANYQALHLMSNIGSISSARSESTASRRASFAQDVRFRLTDQKPDSSASLNTDVNDAMGRAANHKLSIRGNRSRIPKPSYPRAIQKTDFQDLCIPDNGMLDPSAIEHGMPCGSRNSIATSGPTLPAERYDPKKHERRVHHRSEPPRFAARTRSLPASTAAHSSSGASAAFQQNAPTGPGRASSSKPPSTSSSLPPEDQHRAAVKARQNLIKALSEEQMQQLEHVLVLKVAYKCKERLTSTLAQVTFVDTVHTVNMSISLSSDFQSLAMPIFKSTMHLRPLSSVTIEIGGRSAMYFPEATAEAMLLAIGDGFLKIGRSPKFYLHMWAPYPSSLGAPLALFDAINVVSALGYEMIIKEDADRILESVCPIITKLTEQSSINLHAVVREVQLAAYSSGIGAHVATVLHAYIASMIHADAAFELPTIVQQARSALRLSLSQMREFVHATDGYTRSELETVELLQILVNIDCTKGTIVLDAAIPDMWQKSVEDQHSEYLSSVTARASADVLNVKLRRESESPPAATAKKVLPERVPQAYTLTAYATLIKRDDKFKLDVRKKVASSCAPTRKSHTQQLMFCLQNRKDPRDLRLLVLPSEQLTQLEVKMPPGRWRLQAGRATSKRLGAPTKAPLLISNISPSDFKPFDGGVDIDPLGRVDFEFTQSHTWLCMYLKEQVDMDCDVSALSRKQLGQLELEYNRARADATYHGSVDGEATVQQAITGVLATLHDNRQQAGQARRALQECILSATDPRIKNIAQCILRLLYLPSQWRKAIAEGEGNPTHGSKSLLTIAHHSALLLQTLLRYPGMTGQVSGILAAVANS